MSYQVLARKWRPRSYKEMAGQGHVLKTLINALDNDRLHHAYLFTGTRGVGKTTIARILARCLNCEEGLSSEPCGVCSSCVEIEEGRFIDLIEVDAASRTKVEDTRELLDNVQYAPSRGRYKVYLIDEVHMLSGHSFNALLKTLEEPPPHVKFLLATTDPQKLPITVLSRCLQFSLKNLSPEMIMNHLKFILGEEKIEFEEEALWQIGRAAKGSVRDALTLLDQAISFCDGKITDSEISSFLGTIDQNILYELIDALILGDALAALETIRKASDQAPDFASVLEALLSYFHRLAIAHVVPEGLDNSQGDKKQVLAHAKSLSAENVQLYYQIALKGREDLPLAVDDRSGIEMTLLRMLAFTPNGVPNKPMATLGDSQAGEMKQAADEAEKKKTVKPFESEKESPALSADEALLDSLSEQTEPTNPNSAQARPDSLDKQSAPEKLNEVEALKEKPSLSSEEITDKNISENTDIKELEHSASAQTAIKSELSLSSLKPEDWISLYYGLDLQGITKSIAAHCQLKTVSNNQIILTLEKSQAAVFNEGHQQQIEESMSNYFGSKIELSMQQEELDPSMETPVAYRLKKQQERQRIAEEAFHNDDNVKMLLENFEGNVLSDSIEPLTPEDY